VRFDAIAFTAESLLLVGRAAVVVFCLASLEPSLLLTCKLLVELQYIVESAETTIFENTNLRKNVLPPLDQQRGLWTIRTNKRSFHLITVTKQTYQMDAARLSWLSQKKWNPSWGRVVVVVAAVEWCLRF